MKKLSLLLALSASLMWSNEAGAQRQPALVIDQPELYIDNGSILVLGTNFSETLEIRNYGANHVQVRAWNFMGLVLDEVRPKWHAESGIAIHGESGNDVIRNLTPFSAEMYGGPGSDTIVGGDSGDVIQGGSGNDTIYGNGGNDVIGGEEGNDLIYGGAGNDVIGGNSGADTIYGESGNDVIAGNSESDELHGGSGGDNIDGGNGDDQIYGNSGHDTLIGGADSDYVRGGSGNDTIMGGYSFTPWGADSAPDTLIGDGGSDFFVFEKTDDRVGIHNGASAVWAEFHRGYSIFEYGPWDCPPPGVIGSGSALRGFHIAG